MRRCKYCEFFNEVDNDGYCYRYPPKLVAINKELQSEYPLVDRNEDWCGEFKEKQVVDAIEA